MSRPELQHGRRRLYGKLNVFQRTMLHWDDLHAYNAVHVAKVFEPLDGKRLNSVINAFLARHGLKGLTLDVASGRYEFCEDPAGQEMKLLSSEPELFSEVEQQLNMRFPRAQVFTPFRFFVAPNQGSFWFGVAYFHAIADAESVVRLLKDLVDNYCGKQGGAAKELERYGHIQNGGPFGVLAKKLQKLPRLIANMRRSCRPPYRDVDDLNNGFRYFSLACEDLAVLRKTAKVWEVTINDLFLATLINALAPLAEKRVRGHRSKISVGCIVNTRKELLSEDERHFGLYLGSFIVTCELPRNHKIGGTEVTRPKTGEAPNLVTSAPAIKELAKEVQRQTQVIKTNKLYLGAPMEMLFGRLMLPLFSTERRKKLYQKHYPLWGGITNMNLNTLWPQDEQRLFDYFRAVSTGPVTPLVFSITTVADHVNVGVSFRLEVYSTEEIQQVNNGFINQVAGLRGNL